MINEKKVPGKIIELDILLNIRLCTHDIPNTHQGESPMY